MVTVLAAVISMVAVILAYVATRTAVDGFEHLATRLVMLVLTAATVAAVTWVGHGLAVSHRAGDLGDALSFLAGSVVALVVATVVMFALEWLPNPFSTPPAADATCRRCGEGLYAHRGQRFVRYHSNAGHLCPESFWQPGKRLYEAVEVGHGS